MCWKHDGSCIFKKSQNTLGWQDWEQLEIFSPLTQLTVKGVFHSYKVKALKNSFSLSEDVNKTAFAFKSSIIFDSLFKTFFSLKQRVT